VKIGDIRTTVVSVPQKRAYKSSWRRGYQGSTAQTSVLVELTTDDGLTGIGEAPVVFAGRPEVTVALIEAIKDMVLGRDPFDHDIVRRQIYAETAMSHFGTQGLSWALSGIDTALWDLVGQACGQPIHRLWGSAWRSQSPFYGDIPAGDPAEMGEEAKEWVARGFRTLYFKVGFGLDLDVARARAVRGAVGDGPRLRVDANQGWSPGAARRVIAKLAEFDLEYVEQPVPASNLEDMAFVRQTSPIPILAHEASLTVDGSLNVIKHQAADALQLDPRFDAGIAGARVAASIAETAGLPVVTHTFGELGVATASVLHLHAAHQNFILDNQTYYWNLTDDIIEDGLMQFDGPCLPVPTGPGLGVKLDPARVKHYSEYHRSEVADRPRHLPDDPFYDRDYIMRPRA
jgi:L-alanine-DL-glutamate epimerase-like enolase superfamily enzyme